MNVTEEDMAKCIEAQMCHKNILQRWHPKNQYLVEGDHVFLKKACNALGIRSKYGRRKGSPPSRIHGVKIWIGDLIKLHEHCKKQMELRLI